MRIIFFATLLCLLAAPMYGHQCILSGTGASEIAIYNACKNDAIMGLEENTSPSDAANEKIEEISHRLILLEAENRQLQAKLNSLRNRLLELMKDL